MNFPQEHPAAWLGGCALCCAVSMLWALAADRRAAQAMRLRLQSLREAERAAVVAAFALSLLNEYHNDRTPQ